MNNNREIIDIPSHKEDGAENDIGPDGRSKIVTELWQTVSELKAQGTYSCGGKLSTTLPGLNINGYGEVGFPLRGHEAKQLISLCQPALVGQRATDSMDADTSLNHTWQLDTSKFQLLNTEFVQSINSLMELVAEELGLGPRPLNVSIQLSKLLIYETGGSYLPPNDETIKEQGVFGTMILTLPSISEGGDLVVSHQGLSKTLKAENSTYSTNYSAFFNDCEREMLPVTSGYRLALVYNIVSLGTGPLPQPAPSDAVIKVTDCIHRWTNLASSPSKAVFIIEHKHTPDGVPLGALKHHDKDMARMLRDSTKGTNLELYVAVLTRLASEADRENYTIRSLFNAAGDQVNIEIPVNRLDVYPAKYFKHKKADDFDEASDSDDSSEYRYYAMALVLLAKDKLIDIIATGNAKGCMEYIVSFVAKNLAIESRDAPEWQSCKRLVQLFLENQRSNLPPTISFLDSLIVLGDLQSVNTYISKMERYNIHFRPELPQLMALLEQCLVKFGWEGFYVSLKKLVGNYFGLDEATMFLTRVIANLSFGDRKMHEADLQILARFLIKRPPFILNCEPSTLVKMAEIASALDPLLLPNVFAVFSQRWIRGASTLAPVLAEILQSIPSIVQQPEFVEVAQEVLASLETDDLQKSTELPEDWSLQTSMSCLCKRLCSQVTVFLKDPEETEAFVALPKKDRKHIKLNLEPLVKKNLISVQKDETTSRPTLVITKLVKESIEIKSNALKFQAMVAALRHATSPYEQEEERQAKKQKIRHGSS